MKPTNPSERQIVLAILEEITLRYHHWELTRVEPASAVRARAYRSAGGYARKMPEDAWADGVADILGIAPRHRPLALEVKSKTGRQSDSQKAWQERWEHGGGHYAIVRSPEEAILALLEAEVS